MKLVEINWNPTRPQLRQFGLISLIALPLVAWFWTGRVSNAVVMSAGIGLSIAVMGWLLPRALKPIFLALMLVTAPIGMVVGELSMLLIYYCLFLPIGLLFRSMGRDRLRLKLDKNAESYWQVKQQPESVASYYRQS